MPSLSKPALVATAAFICCFAFSTAASAGEPSCKESKLTQAIKAIATAGPVMQQTLATAIPRSGCKNLPEDYEALLHSFNEDTTLEWSELTELESWKTICADPDAANEALEADDVSTFFDACGFGELGSVNKEQLEEHENPQLAVLGLATERLLVEWGAGPGVSTAIGRTIAGLGARQDRRRLQPYGWRAKSDELTCAVRWEEAWTLNCYDEPINVLALIFVFAGTRSQTRGR